MAWLWPRLRAPLYATPFTAFLLRPHNGSLREQAGDLDRAFDLEMARRSLDASVLLTIGAAIGISVALDTSGAARSLALVVQGLLGHGQWQALLAVYLGTLLLTQMITNNAAVALMVPLALAMASELGMAVRPLLLAVIMAASASYATPMGYQTNLMVYGPGGYRFSDYLRLGVPLHLITAIVALALLAPMLGE